jgi:chromosome segregation ATPase
LLFFFQCQIKKLQGKVEILNTQNQDLKEQNTDLMGKIRSSDETERSNLSSILELRDQLSKRLSQITALENDIQSKNKVIKELSSRAASNEMSKKSNFENERLELAEESATLSMQLTAAKKKNEKIPRLEKQIMSAKSVEKKHKEAMKELKKIQKENDSLIAETKNLQLECSKNKNNLKEMSRSLLTYQQGQKRSLT